MVEVYAMDKHNELLVVAGYCRHENEMVECDACDHHSFVDDMPDTAEPVNMHLADDGSHSCHCNGRHFDFDMRLGAYPNYYSDCTVAVAVDGDLALG